MQDSGAVTAPALVEISVTSTLDVAKKGAETVEALGHLTGEDVEVLVVVRPSRPASARPAADRT